MLPSEILLNSELASSGNPDLLQHYNCCFLSHGLCDLRLCCMCTKWSHLPWNHITGCTRLRCHLWHNSNDHCHCHCIQLDNEVRSFCFPCFSSKISWPHFAISACPRALSLPRNCEMLTCSTADQNLTPMILIWSTGTPEEFLQLLRFALFLMLASHFSDQYF